MTDLPAIRRGDLVALLGKGRISAVRAVALARPMGEIVAATLQAAARSPRTVKAYGRAIGLFLQYLDGALGEAIPADWRPLASTYKEAGSDPHGRQVAKTAWAFGGYAALLAAVTPGHVDGYRAWREAQGDSANTASQRVYATRTFLAVAYRDGILTDGQATRLGVTAYRQRQKRDTKPTGRRLTKEEARALRGAIPTDTPKGRRDLGILDLQLYLGLRSAEVAGLRLGDFRQDSGRWWVMVTGKGSKTRRIKLHDVAFGTLSAWLGDYGHGLGDDAPAFVSVNRGGAVGEIAINTSTVGRLVATYGAGAGLASETGENCLSPHDLRRTAARTAFDRGANLVQVQAMLGHASPDTTARYIGSYESDDTTAVDFITY